MGWFFTANSRRPSRSPPAHFKPGALMTFVCRCKVPFGRVATGSQRSSVCESFRTLWTVSVGEVGGFVLSCFDEARVKSQLLTCKNGCAVPPREERHSQVVGTNASTRSTRTWVFRLLNVR